MDLVFAGRTIAEIAGIEHLSTDTITKDYRAGLEEAGALLNRDGRLALAIESIGRVRRRAQAMFGERPDHTSHQRHAVGLQAERLLNDILDTPTLLSAGADQNRYSAFEDSWGDTPPPNTDLSMAAGAVQPDAEDFPASASGHAAPTTPSTSTNSPQPENT